jgi:DNA polymerase (family 10)
MIREARRAGLGTDVITAVGSLRRFAPAVDDVTLLAIVPTEQHQGVLAAFTRLSPVSAVLAQQPSSVTVDTTRGPLTLHVAAPDQAGAALVWHTGTGPHVARLQARSARLSLHFADGLLTRADGAPVPCPSEPQFYAALDLPFIAPELRGGDGELEAADAGVLPRLISEYDIRGDLHTHSSWSDGRNTIADMVSAARQLGYQYIAITDHSERAWSSRTLAEEDFDRQREEIDRVRARARGIEVLHGIEVDIMPDGSLDFGDEVLERFDIVLASLHDPAGHDGTRLTERYLRAIRHPLVNVITHPTNRAPGRADGYVLDFAALFAAAADTGTALEIDGGPGHLDLDGALARRAVAAGATLAIDSDSHRLDAMGRQMLFGVGTARRGWIEPQHVLNTRSAAEVRAFIARKRARASAPVSDSPR